MIGEAVGHRLTGGNEDTSRSPGRFRSIKKTRDSIGFVRFPASLAPRGRPRRPKVRFALVLISGFDRYFDASGAVPEHQKDKEFHRFCKVSGLPGAQAAEGAFRLSAHKRF